MAVAGVVVEVCRQVGGSHASQGASPRRCKWQDIMRQREMDGLTESRVRWKSAIFTTVVAFSESAGAEVFFAMVTAAFKDYQKIRLTRL